MGFFDRVFGGIKRGFQSIGRVTYGSIIRPAYDKVIRPVGNAVHNKILAPTVRRAGDLLDGAQGLVTKVASGVGDGVQGLGKGVGNLGQWLPILLLAGGGLAVVYLMTRK